MVTASRSVAGHGRRPRARRSHHRRRCAALCWSLSPRDPGPVRRTPSRSATATWCPSAALSPARAPRSVFTASLALPDWIVSSLAAQRTAPAGARLDATSAAGRDALRLVDRRSLTLPSPGPRPWPTRSPRSRRPRTSSTSPPSTTRASSRPERHGAAGPRDHRRRVLEGRVQRRDQRYRRAVHGQALQHGRQPPRTAGSATTSWTWSRRPTASSRASTRSSGSDQLVLFVPPSCSSGGVVGEGTVGNSFASGGAADRQGGHGHRGHLCPRDRPQLRLRSTPTPGSGVSLEYYGIYDVMGFALVGRQQADRAQHAVPGIPGDHRRRRGPGRRPRQRALAGARHRDHPAAQRRHRAAQRPGEGPGHRRGPLPRLPLGHRTGRGVGVRRRRLRPRVRERDPLYAPGVTINAARTVDGAPAASTRSSWTARATPRSCSGATWTNASGDLSVHVSEPERHRC